MYNAPEIKGKPKFLKGNPGRPKGSQNKASVSIREAFTKVFNDAQNDPKLAKYSLYSLLKDNKSLFYMLASKLIPIEVNNTLTKDITIRVERIDLKDSSPPAIIDIPHEEINTPCGEGIAT